VTAENRRTLDEAMSEKELQRAVLALAAVYGYRAYHTHDSRRSHKGFPDLTLVGRGRVIFAELKSQGGKVSPDQADWLADLQRVGGTVRAYVWRPSDLDAIPGLLK